MSTTGTVLIANAKELADLTNSTFVSDAQWLVWVNEGLRELHGVIASASQDAFYKTVDFPIATGNTETLPSDFLRLKGLDLDPDLDTQKSVRRFNFGERNDANRSNPGSYPWCPDRRYRVVNRATLMIEPRVKGPGNYRAYYVPRPVLLVTAGDTLQDELDPWSEYIQIKAAIAALGKQEKDTTVLTGRLNQMRLDIEASAPTDEAEADSITDVEYSPGYGWR